MQTCSPPASHLETGRTRFKLGAHANTSSRVQHPYYYKFSDTPPNNFPSYNNSIAAYIEEHFMKCDSSLRCMRILVNKRLISVISKLDIALNNSKPFQFAF